MQNNDKSVFDKIQLLISGIPFPSYHLVHVTTLLLFETSFPVMVFQFVH